MGRKPLVLEPHILEQILQQLKEGKPQYKIAKDFNLSPVYISRLKKRVISKNIEAVTIENNDSPTI